MSDPIPQTTDEWWKEWKKPDGTPCTRMEMLRAFAQMRARNKRMMRFFDPAKWLTLLADDKPK